MILTRYFFALIALLLSAPALMAQEEMPTRRGSRIIDDTTKQVYGPTTSRYFYETDVFNNAVVYHTIDTSSHNFHHYGYVQRHNNQYQDLGIIGTSMRPIFYQLPENIGVSSGFHSYDLYWQDEEIKYYDTKSPYSNMRVILGGKGRSLTRATYSRNINPRWNFGFTYRGLFIDKPVARTGKGDRISRSNYYDAYTSFQSKDSTYRLFLNFRRNFIQVDEYGGIRDSDDPTFEYSSFFAVNAQPWLTQAESNDTRTNLHLFHQYEIGRALQLYHTADRYRQENKFSDIRSREPADYFNAIVIEDDAIQDETVFKTFRNEAGIKGNLLRLFYNGYVAVRHFTMEYNHFTPDSMLVPVTGNESYLGGRMALRLDSIGEIGGWAEFMQDGNYRIQGNIKSKWFEASVAQMQYAPGFAQQGYRGALHRWREAYDDVEATHLNGYVHYASKTFRLSPGISFTRLRNYVYFNQLVDNTGEQEVFPVQTTDNQVIVSPELRTSVTFFRHLTLSGQAIYTHFIENAGDAIVAPELFVNGQLAYANIFFNGNLDMQAGVDVHWKSAYNAPAYDPAIRQFYNQTIFQTPAFAIVDVFFNARIKRGRIFLKFNNLVQALTGEGYIPTPYYPGQRNVLDFGFDWSFYD